MIGTMQFDGPTIPRGSQGGMSASQRLFLASCATPVLVWLWNFLNGHPYGACYDGLVLLGVMTLWLVWGVVVGMKKRDGRTSTGMIIGIIVVLLPIVMIVMRVCWILVGR